MSSDPIGVKKTRTRAQEQRRLYWIVGGSILLALYLVLATIMYFDVSQRGKATFSPADYGQNFSGLLAQDQNGQTMFYYARQAPGVTTNDTPLIEYLGTQPTRSDDGGVTAVTLIKFTVNGFARIVALPSWKVGFLTNGSVIPRPSGQTRAGEDFAFVVYKKAFDGSNGHDVASEDKASYSGTATSNWLLSFLCLQCNTQLTPATIQNTAYWQAHFASLTTGDGFETLSNEAIDQVVFFQNKSA